MNSLVQYIIDNYKGSNIIIITTAYPQAGGVFTGEVIDGFDNIITLKNPTTQVTNFVNGDEIVLFF